MLVAVSEFPIICRICLEKGDLIPLEENIIEIIEVITDVNVMSESDLPKNICSKCIKDLMNISMFMDKMKYNTMFLKFVLLNRQITIKKEPSEEIICEPQIDIYQIEQPASTIKQTSILRNLVNYENSPKEKSQQNSISTGYKFDKNNVKSIKKENNDCACSKIQCRECENDSDFETQPLQKKLKIYHSPKNLELPKMKIKKYKFEEYKYKSEPKETLSGCPTSLKHFSTKTTLKKQLKFQEHKYKSEPKAGLLSCPTSLKHFSTKTTLNKHTRPNMTLNWLQSQNSLGTMSLKNNKLEPLITVTPKPEPKLKIDIVKHSAGQKKNYECK